MDALSSSCAFFSFILHEHIIFCSSKLKIILAGLLKEGRKRMFGLVFFWQCDLLLFLVQTFTLESMAMKKVKLLPFVPL